MNNKTLPDLPARVFFAAPSEGYTADQMHQYARDYAASQTAGVASEKIAPVQGYAPGIPWSMHLEAYDVYCKRYGKQQALIEGGCRGGFGTNELDMFIPGWRDRLSEFNAMKARIAELESILAAAPAASGGECRHDWRGDGLCDRCGATYQPQPPTGASVSERARELLAAEYSKCGMQQCATDIRAGVFAAAQQLAVNAIKAALEQKVPSGEVAIVCDWSGVDPFPTFIEAEVGGKSVSLEWRDRPDGLKELIVPVTDSALRALEQALTQQRGCATCGGRGEIGGHVGQTAETFDYVTEPCPECATPQPGAEALREAAEAFLEAADARDNEETATQYPQHELRLRQYKAARDELESLLGRGG